MVLSVTTRKNISGSKPLDKEKSNIAQMFDKIAWRYDFLNHFFSLNIDKIWRRKAVNELRRRTLSHVLDVATGTADLALLLHKRLRPGLITGVDISEGMLAIGREKVEKKGLAQTISLQYGDSEDLPFDDHTFDAVTVAFGVRNFENLDKGLAEMFRVLKNDGKVIILEFSIPRNCIIRGIYYFYFSRILPFVGRLVSKDAYAYNYLPDSVQSFPYGDGFREKMENCGFIEVAVRPLTFGIACLYTGRKSINDF